MSTLLILSNPILYHMTVRIKKSNHMQTLPVSGKKPSHYNHDPRVNCTFLYFLSLGSPFSVTFTTIRLININIKFCYWNSNSEKDVVATFLLLVKQQCLAKMET